MLKCYTNLVRMRTCMPKPHEHRSGDMRLYLRSSMHNLCYGRRNLVILKWTWSIQGPLFVYCEWTVNSEFSSKNAYFVYLYPLSSHPSQYCLYPDFLAATVLISILTVAVSQETFPQVMSIYSLMICTQCQRSDSMQHVMCFIENKGGWWVCGTTDFHAVKAAVALQVQWVVH